MITPEEMPDKSLRDSINGFILGLFYGIFEGNVCVVSWSEIEKPDIIIAGIDVSL